MATDHTSSAPEHTLRQCADKLERLSQEFLRGAVSKRELRDVARWLREQADSYVGSLERAKEFARRRAKRVAARKKEATSLSAAEAVASGSVLGGLRGGSAQAKVPHTCHCGRVIYGNGGFAAHRSTCPEYIRDNEANTA
jgi:hypothetical protein